jgi:mannose/fructose-specific phosphotransferase system component IIA
MKLLSYVSLSLLLSLGACSSMKKEATAEKEAVSCTKADCKKCCDKDKKCKDGKCKKDSCAKKAQAKKKK